MTTLALTVDDELILVRFGTTDTPYEAIACQLACTFSARREAGVLVERVTCRAFTTVPSPQYDFLAAAQRALLTVHVRRQRAGRAIADARCAVDALSDTYETQKQATWTVDFRVHGAWCECE